LNGEPGVLVISAKRSNGEMVSEAYTVAENRDRGNLLGYRIEKTDGTVYDLNAELIDCSCPDFTINRAHATTAELRACKHCRGLKAALVKIG
jgi:predicted nucleic acid-binding Zn finger protein